MLRGKKCLKHFVDLVGFPRFSGLAGNLQLLIKGFHPGRKNMQTLQIVAIAIVVIAVLAAIGWLVYTRKRSERLRDHFGTEYDRRVSELEGDRRRAEAELTEREARVQELKHRPLSSSERARLIEEWRRCQARFVDDPEGAVDDADQLLSDIMRTRGYRIEDRNDRLADLCAAYPDRASDFRQTNELFIKHRSGNASTEELRKAFVHFRTLFDEMLGGHDEELKRAS